MAADTDRFPIVELDAIRMAGKRRVTRRFGRLMLIALLVTPLLLAFAPWQQNLAGQGRQVWRTCAGRHPGGRKERAPGLDRSWPSPRILRRQEEKLV